MEEHEKTPVDHLPSSAALSSDFFLDECPALLSQVPESFDLGRTRVRLNSVAASVRHIAVGSECGALFLFNRRIGQSVKPLRTDHCEVISAMEFCSDGSNGTELLAVGHRSGKLVILSLPCADAANPKLLQHVQDEAHRHSEIRCLCWSVDGRILFSGDELGMVLATHVDFTNEQFPIGVVEAGEGSGGGEIVAMCSSGPFFAFARDQKCKVFNWKRDSETVAEVTAQKQIVSIHLSSNAVDHLSLLLSDGTIWRKFLSEKDENLYELGSISSDLFLGRQLRVVPFSDYNGPSWALWAQNGHIETCCLGERGFAVERLALEGRVDQVLSVCASSSPALSPLPSSADELFLLSAPSVHPLQQRRRIFRLSRASSAHLSLTICPPSPTNGHSLLFDYFYGTVEKAVGELGRLKNATAESDGTETGNILSRRTEELLGRMNRELDVFLMGDGAKEVDEVDGCKTTNNLADFLPEFGSVFPEKTTKIATGIHQIFGQFRQHSSNFFSSYTEGDSSHNQNEKSTENDHLSLGGTSNSQRREGRDSSTKKSLPLTESVCSFGDDGLGGFAHLTQQITDGDTEAAEKEERGKVRVDRKRIVVRRKKMKNGRRTDRDEEKEERKGKRRKASVGEQRHVEEEEDGTLSDWEQQRTTANWESTEAVGTERRGQWSPGAVPDERQQLILQVLGIVPKPTTSVEGESSETLAPSKLQIQMKKVDSEVEEPNGRQLKMSKNENGEERDRGSDNAQLAELQINAAKGYSFPAENDEQFSEDEFPPIVPSVSLSDLIALFPPPTPGHSSVSAALPSSSPPLSSPPPFSSSPLSSSASSSFSSFFVHPSPHYQRLLRLSPTDQWRRLDMPFTAGDLTLCRHYLIACPGHKRTTKNTPEEKQRPHYLMANLLEDERATDEWVPLRVNASAVAVNDEGTLLWRMYDGIAYSPCSPPDPICPSTTLSRTTAWMEMSNQFEGEIVQIALNSRNSWFLADTGRAKKERTVWVQMFLPEMGIFHRAVDEDNRHFFTQLAVSNHAVWTLSGGFVVARVGLKLDLAPMGLDWADIDGQPRKFVSIALHEQTGFGLERNGTVWFVHGVAENAPFGHGPWFRVCSSPVDTSLGRHSLFSPSVDWRLRVGTPGVFVVVGSALLHTNAPLVGSHFGHVVPDRLALNDHFTLFTASGLCGPLNSWFRKIKKQRRIIQIKESPPPIDSLFLCHPSSNELFSFSLRKRHFTSLPPYCSDSVAKVQSLSATRACLFVLDKSGRLYVRPAGQEADGNGGRKCRHWSRVKRPSEHSSSEMDGDFAHQASPATLVSVAACCSSVWAVSDDGSVWASRSIPQPSDDGPLSDEEFGMTWIKIDGPTIGKTADQQIRVSPSGSAVWLFSKSGFVWYRTGLTESNWTGEHWTTSKTLQSIRIDELAVNDVTVWALASGTGHLHRLCSDGWQSMNVRLRALSVDALEGRLWALDNEFRIVRHEMASVSRPPPSDAVSFDHPELENSENMAPWHQKITRKTKEIRKQLTSPVTVGDTSEESGRWAFRRIFSFFK